MPAKRTCVLRFHESATRVNWGGRATSLALVRLLEATTDRSVVSTIGAPHILGQLTDFDARPPDGSAFDSLDRLAAAIVSDSPATPKLAYVHDALARADELVVNGEGDFILSERVTLMRTLAIMRAAKMMGKQVHLVNSILSRAPLRRTRVPHIVHHVGETLALCGTVMYRDPASLRLHRSLFPSLRASWTPDAVFGWADVIDNPGSWATSYAPESEGLDLSVQRLLHVGARYVVVSGTSRAGVSLEDFARSIDSFSSSLARYEIGVVFGVADSPDRKFADVLDAHSIPIVAASTPLAAVTRVLWNAVALVSGRYHPSILASLSGTPFLSMQSNSHKTNSLHRVIDSGFAPVEHTFFAGGTAQSAQLAKLVASATDAPDLRARVRRSAILNGIKAHEGYARLLDDD